MYFPTFFKYIFLYAMQLFSANPIISFLCTQKVEKNNPKNCILMAVYFFSVCSPYCPKKPRTEYPFYRLFYSIVSASVSGINLYGC